ncbi:MAG: NAD(P)/FAD-dependent oxidoreductase [Anaerolineae bacterium]|jgi:protoporphyrinogen oxidase|nr:NAD(P)/FAD-dependent oxidoreductase [Anaerolineae bacterium]MBT7070274.1 NAD(P)/FAD-dependent oxidoreductase [Anaerolineae bacterium]MBT7324282.1 NAD(P)/FAD-dependent oxidoreductase [Anaerolineae bacterium]
MKIAIIGAGYAGMSAAYDLAKAGHEITIYEAEDSAGGLARGFKDPKWDWTVDRFYHHWFASDDHMLGIIEELGLSDKVLFPRPYTVLMHDEKWYPFDSIKEALLFPGLGWGVDKLRFGLVGLYLRLTKNWQDLEKVTVDAWMRKWVGKRVYEQMWEPMLIGKFGKYHKDVPMSWFWARIHARTTKLGTFVGGFQAFADSFVEKLRGLGVEVRFSVRITKIVRKPAQKVSVFGEAGAEEYDKVLVTTSPSVMSYLVPDLPEDYLGALKKLKHMGAVVLVAALKHQLSEDNYYWFNLPKKDGFPFLALVEHTNYVDPAHFGGEHIVYAGDYLEPGHANFYMSAEELMDRFAESFARINPKFERDWVRKVWAFKADYAQPVPLVGHSQNIPAIETPVEGIYFASMSQVYPWDRGTNFAVEIGRRAARLMMG